MNQHTTIKIVEKILLFNLNSFLELKDMQSGKLIDKKEVIHNIVIKNDFHIDIIKNAIIYIIKKAESRKVLNHINTIELYLCDELLDEKYIMKIIFTIKKNKIIYYKFQKEETDLINDKLKEIYKKYVFYRCDIN